MYIIDNIIRKIHNNLVQLKWSMITTLLLGHFLFGYGFYSLINEPLADNLIPFIYYHFTTISTIGYGDLSPTSDLGMLFFSFWYAIIGIALLSTVIGKLTVTVHDFLRKGLKGMRDYSKKENHIIIFGWHGAKTLNMINLILADKNRDQRDIILCVDEQIENPDPDNILFVQTNNILSDDAFYRTGLKNASKVIILGKNDNETTTISLSVAMHVNGNTHIVTHFDKEEAANIVKKTCPKVACNVSNSIEMLVRTMQDPGSNELYKILLSANIGPTQFSMKSGKDLKYGNICEYFRKEFNSTVIGLSKHNDNSENGYILNANNDFIVQKDDTIYFISNERIKYENVNWDEI